ncbi:MAG: homoserine kinase [Candidatus Kapabacteria bacterium]|jgi:homoserine kinase|nr:homoserine kinase [Candidatus Kapabacteria bacterium]
MKAVKTEATAFAPATVANVACGFDVLGFALESPGDEVTVRVTEERGVRITAISSDDGLPDLNLPTNPQENTAGGAVLAYLDGEKAEFGVEMSIRKRMPAGSGMGSSAASAAAALVALNALVETPLTPEALVDYGMKGEAIASGSEHADNVAPAIMGGIVLIRGYQPTDVVRIPSPNNLYCTVIRPHCEVSTKEARGILPKEIPMKTAITQWGNLAGLIAGLMKCDEGLISRSLQDVVAEPHRAALIPGFHAMKQAAIGAGALGCSISGSGPSVFALSASREAAEAIGKAMHEALTEACTEGTLYISRLSDGAPRIVSLR